MSIPVAHRLVFKYILSVQLVHISARCDITHQEIVLSFLAQTLQKYFEAKSMKNLYLGLEVWKRRLCVSYCESEVEFQWNINSLPHTQSGKVNIAQELGSREYRSTSSVARGADLTLEWRSLKQRRRMEDFIWRHIFASFGPFIHHTSVSPFCICSKVLCIFSCPLAALYLPLSFIN